MHLFLKPKPFQQNFIQFQILHKIYNIFKKKNEPSSLSVLEVIDCEKRENFNAQDVLYQKILWQWTFWRLPNNAQVCESTLLLNLFIILT